MGIQITQQILEDLFSYSPEGYLINKVDRGRTAKAGKRTCKENVKSYRQVSLFGKMYREHQLIWCLLKGEWPPLVDHKDQNRLNNKIDNLQILPHKANIRKSFLGKNIWFNTKSKRYAVAIYINNKKKHIGCFLDYEEAVAARKEAEEKYWSLNGPAD